jgi:hypothetical protein
MEQNRYYCHRHSYEYLNISNIGDLPTQWMKVNLALLVMRSAAAGGIVVWLDSDAVIVDKNRRVEDVFAALAPGDDSVFLSSGSNGLLGQTFDGSVFMVRTGDVGRQLLEDWIDLYSPKNWIHPGAGQPWRLSVASGTEKDLPDGAFMEGILPRYKKHIRLVEDDIFNCVTPNFADVRVRVFSCHFHGPYQSRIQDYLISGGTGRGYERPVVGVGGLDILSWRGAGLVLAGVALGGALIWGLQVKVERSAPFLTAARNLSSHIQRTFD